MSTSPPPLPPSPPPYQPPPSPSPSPSPSPAQSLTIPWEVLNLIATNLDPKTLATASCVSKQWCTIMTSDHLWEHLCTTHYPSITHLRSTTVPYLPYHRIYNLGYNAAKRRKPPPPQPKITLQNLLFIITFTTSSCSPPVIIITPGTALELDPKSLFRFDIDVGDHKKWLEYFEVVDETRVTWNVVLRGYEGVFTMMDCKGRGSFFSGSDGWFSAELPVSGCCCCGGSSGMVAEMRLAVREEVGGDGRRRVVGSVGVGVLSVVSWRYVCVDDGLRYLQHFLEPCDV